MKKLLIIIVSILVLLAMAIIVFHKKPATLPSDQNGATFPTTNSTTTAQNSFLQDPNVKEDPQNPGNYYIGNQPPQDQSTNPPYLIGYDSQTAYFNITLFQEPIGQLRIEAERYLQQQLHLTTEQMCSLKYIVDVPDWVNSQYSGMNLGFSFCPGAVQLPS